MAENEPWVTCFLTHILITYIEEAFQGKGAIDYPGLFEGAEGFDTPSDPEIFLREGDNWVPLSVFTKLLAQCEKISAQKDVSYHAAKSFFDPARKQLPSLFEIIVRVLNNLRSAFLFISSSLWESVQTNFIRLQSFEGQGSEPALFMLAQYSEGAKPTVGAVYFLRGMAEGFPRLYPFVDEIQCIEEISQLSIRAIVQEFPDYRAVSEGDRLFVCHKSSRVPAVEARKV